MKRLRGGRLDEAAPWWEIRLKGENPLVEGGLADNLLEALCMHQF